MENIWSFLPAAVAARVKAVVAVIGGIAFVVVSFYPGLASNHYIAGAIAVLTALGVYVLPNVTEPSARVH